MHKVLTKKELAKKQKSIEKGNENCEETLAEFVSDNLRRNKTLHHLKFNSC